MPKPKFIEYKFTPGDYTHLPIRYSLRLIDIGPPLVYLVDDQVEISVDFQRGIITAPEEAPADILADLEKLTQPDPSPDKGRRAERKRLFGKRADVVGKRLDELNRPQKDYLLDLLFMKSKLLDNEGNIRPIVEWLGYDPNEQ